VCCCRLCAADCEPQTLHRRLCAGRQICARRRAPKGPNKARKTPSSVCPPQRGEQTSPLGLSLFSLAQRGHLLAAQTQLAAKHREPYCFPISGRLFVAASFIWAARLELRLGLSVAGAQAELSLPIGRLSTRLEPNWAHERRARAACWRGATSELIVCRWSQNTQQNMRRTRGHLFFACKPRGASWQRGSLELVIGRQPSTWSFSVRFPLRACAIQPEKKRTITM